MKKKILVTLLIILMLCVTDTFAAGKKEEQKFVIKMASPSQPADSCVKAFFHFEEIVEKESKGRIDAQVMHSGQLGSARDYIEGLQMGSIQMAEITTSVLTALESKFMVMDLPYISKNVDHLRRVLDSGVGDMLAKP
jgi:TRAP-type C4-dicarboxylate transport system substrate-binding protein